MTREEFTALLLVLGIAAYLIGRGLIPLGFVLYDYIHRKLYPPPPFGQLLDPRFREIWGARYD